MSIKVLEASAGSGKTYQLSMFYVKLALENPNNFKKYSLSLSLMQL